MTAREKEEAFEKKYRKYCESGGNCYICGKQISWHEAQAAHKLGQTKANLKKYGKELIHHPKNMEIVCSLRCNSKVDISFNPEACKALVKEIEGERD